jgi:type VI secretion system FHA domain protein
MILTLEVMGEKAAALGAGSRKIFHSIGGTIGRLPDNDWVFPDPYVSGRHALIRYLNGKFFIEDTSTNGVFINSPGNRLSKTQAHPLRSGDVLYIDAYQIRVAIEKEIAGGKAADELARLQERPIRGAIPPPPARSRAPAAQEEDRTASLAISSAEDEGTEWFALGEALPPEHALPAPGRSDLRPAPVSGHLAPQPPSRRVPPPPTTRPTPMYSSPGRATFKTEASAAQVNAMGDATQFRELLSAAGIEGLDPSSDLARTFGEILRVVVGGLMEVLRARERMKDELRMRGTTFQPAHNNPLKFSANVDDAFHNLLVKRNPAYLAPTDAFEDALQDIRDHQTAILAATRLAFETMLAQFDPDRLQEEFDRLMKKGSILGVPAKLRYWDLYRDKYGNMVKDADTSYRKLFGEEFAKAYEEQLARLKAMSR